MRCGARMNATFIKMGPDVGCGSPRKLKIPLYFMSLIEKKSHRFRTLEEYINDNYLKT